MDILYCATASIQLDTPTHDTPSNGSNFGVNMLMALCERNSTVTVEFPSQSDAELWYFLWSAPEQTIEQIIEKTVIWKAISLIMTSL